MKSSSIGRHILNFGSGPAVLPPEVLKEASEAIVDYNGNGLSILEIPHRGRFFDEILEESKSLIKELCELHDDYEVLWLQGGGRMQFCMIPMNFLDPERTAGYIDSGHWSAEAVEYAHYYGKTSTLASSMSENYACLPELPSAVPKDLSYIHITTNNTIYGTQWADLPLFQAPLIADMSSDILSRNRNYNACSLFYAAAQKNVGPAGTTLVVVHKDLLKKQIRKLPSMLDYNMQVKSNSVLNTPPVFAIYVSLLMLRWTKRKTIGEIENDSIAKSDLLYQEIDRNSIFRPVVTVKEHRSRTNVCFVAAGIDEEKAFAHFCVQNNIIGIEGHRSVGGFRASLYNAMPLSGVQTLVAVMQEFERVSTYK